MFKYTFVFHIAYNNMLDYLDAQVANGQAFVIRPKKASGIGRIEKDKEKLMWIAGASAMTRRFALLPGG